jgi:hypothetical protein
MCTFENEQSIVVCDSAIQQVRAAVNAAFGEAVRYTSITGQGTRIEAKLSIDEEAFQEVARSAIAAASMSESITSTPMMTLPTAFSHGLLTQGPGTARSLNRKLAERRVFPAIDISLSSTRLCLTTRCYTSLW